MEGFSFLSPHKNGRLEGKTCNERNEKAISFPSRRENEIYRRIRQGIPERNDQGFGRYAPKCMEMAGGSIGGVVTKEQDKSCDLSCLVAGAGLEPATSGL